MISPVGTVPKLSVVYFYGQIMVILRLVHPLSLPVVVKCEDLSINEGNFWHHFIYN